MTADIKGSYQLIVIDLVHAQRVLTVPLPAAPPAVPPYLTWLGWVIVATDVTGGWSAPSLVIQLAH